MSSISSSLESQPGSRVAAQAAYAELSRLNRWVVLAIICVGLFMTTLDTGIIDILNPVFTRQYHLDLYQEYWIELSFAIPLIGVLLPAGHLGDRLGRKNVFLTGIMLFGGGSGLLTLMPDFYSMFIARAIQGTGAGLLAANGGVLAVSSFPWPMRGQVLGIIGASVALGLKAGPVVGAVMAENFGWRSAFLVNVAVGIVFVLLGASLIPESRRIAGRRFDVWGPVWFVLAVTCFLVVVNQAPTLGLLSTPILLLAGGFFVFGYLFIVTSLRAKDPTIDLRLYKIRNFTVAVTAAFISFLALTPVNHLLPFLMIHVLGVQSTESALVFITTTLAIAFTQPFSGRLADRVGSRPVASLGLLLQGVGLLILAVSPLNLGADWLVPQLALIGIGVGMFRSPNHRALFGAVPRDKMGQAGGYQHLPRQMGESVGETGVVTLFTAVVLSSAALAGVPVVAQAPPPTAALVATPAPVAVSQANQAPRISAPALNAGGQVALPVTAAGQTQNAPSVPRPATSGGPAAPLVPKPATSTGPAAPQVPKPATSGGLAASGVPRPATSGGPAAPQASQAGGATGRPVNPLPGALPPVSGAVDDDGDMIVELGEETEGDEEGDEGLSAAVTGLPAEVQIIGYRLMWALAGAIALGGAAMSWFLRDPEGDREPSRTPAAEAVR